MTSHDLPRSQSSVAWICEFLELHGVEALCDLLEMLEKRTFKKPHDFELMDQVLMATDRH